jgi:FKBP-type peptidyl-prolyl cis-trans isomerase
MRRTLLVTTIAALSLAACGGSDSEAGDEPDTTEPDTTEAEVEAGDSVPEAEVLPADTTVVAENPDKPEVELPAELPNELERTVIVAGTGDAAVVGDTVIVDYVGVRSVDGVEFDNSYDRGEPFPVTLGNGSVIQGWEDGLVGAQTGEQVQLDIPSELAYGETARGEVIGENETLTFVIDVRAVVGGADPADAPTEPGVPLSTEEGVAATEFEDLVVGEGATLEQGDTALIRYVNFRGDNGVAIETNWGDPLQVPFEEGLLPGLLAGMDGMNVGGRRAVTIPPEEGFGPDGNPQGGLPADTDMIFVIELIGTY